MFPRRPLSWLASPPARLLGATLLASLAACGPEDPHPSSAAIADGEDAGPPAPPDLSSQDPAVRALIEEHLEAARAAPGSASAQGQLGLVYEANELWLEAEQSLGRAARLEPSEPLWRYHRAIALGVLGRESESLELLQAVSDELPEAAYAAQRLGEGLLGAARFQEAVPAFERAVRLAPESCEGQAGLGAALLALGDPERAVPALARALALDPTYARAHYQLGQALAALGREEEARAELAQGVGGTPRYLADPWSAELRRYAVAASARMRLALELLEVGNPERATRILERLRASAPEDIVVLNNLAIALSRQGRTEEALGWLEQARALDESVASTWINLASVLLDQGMTAGALQHAQHAVELAPDLGRTHLALGRVLLRQGRREQAQEALRRAWELAPDDPSTLALLARNALDLERLEEARSFYSEWVLRRPAEVEARLGLGETQRRLGQRDEALAQLSRARALAPDDPGVLELARQLEAP